MFNLVPGTLYKVKKSYQIKLYRTSFEQEKLNKKNNKYFRFFLKENDVVLYVGIKEIPKEILGYSSLGIRPSYDLKFLYKNKIYYSTKLCQFMDELSLFFEQTLVAINS